jgi:hypothetical protein
MIFLMKNRIAIAVAVGAFISILLLVANVTYPSTLLRYLSLPGHIAIISIWGAHGMDSGSERIALIVGMGVNVVAYGLIALAILKWFRHSDESQ